MTRLNLGSGFGQIAGWTNVDQDEALSPDYVASIEDLSQFEDNSIEEIYASHCLEHVPYDSPALSEWYRVLMPGAACTVVVPDINQIYYLWRHGMSWGPYQLPIDAGYVNATAFGAWILQETMPGAHFPKEGHEHKQIFIHDMLVQQMLAAGFEEVSDVPACSVRAASLGETMVQGRKPVAFLDRPPSPDCYTDQPYCVRRRAKEE